MIPDGNQSNGSRQDFIDLLCRITKSDEATDVQESNGHAQELVNSESEIIIIESQPNAEEGEIITIDDDEEDANSKKKEVEDGELSESPESDVSAARRQLIVRDSILVILCFSSIVDWRCRRVESTSVRPAIPCRCEKAKTRKSEK